MDKEAGFVPIEEIYNVFTEAQRACDESLYPVDGVPPRRVHITEFLDSIKLDLLKRGRRNVAGYLKRHPQLIKQAGKNAQEAARIIKANENAPSDSRDEWARRSALGRSFSRNDEK